MGVFSRETRTNDSLTPAGKAGDIVPVVTFQVPAKSLSGTAGTVTLELQRNMLYSVATSETGKDSIALVNVGHDGILVHAELPGGPTSRPSAITFRGRVQASVLMKDDDDANPVWTSGHREVVTLDLLHTQPDQPAQRAQYVRVEISEPAQQGKSGGGTAP